MLSNLNEITTTQNMFPFLSCVFRYVSRVLWKPRTVKVNLGSHRSLWVLAWRILLSKGQYAFIFFFKLLRLTWLVKVCVLLCPPNELPVSIFGLPVTVVAQRRSVCIPIQMWSKETIKIPSGRPTLMFIRVHVLKHLFMAVPLKEAFAFKCELKWGHLLGSMRPTVQPPDRFKPSPTVVSGNLWWQQVTWRQRLTASWHVWRSRLFTSAVEAFGTFQARNGTKCQAVCRTGSRHTIICTPHRV